jgi:Flp pilus assembly protein TadD
MRSLGWAYFSKEDYAKAAECFTFATKVNYYNPSTWFTLGCCYIRLN